METLWTDVRFGVRQLARERTFSAVVLTTLAVCVAANVAIFSVVSAVLLRPLPYRAADRLVTIYNSYPGAGAERAANAGIDFFLRRERVPALGSVAVYQGSDHTVGEPGGTERVATARVSASLFPLLGVEAARGRTFTEEENEADRARQVVLTDGFWRERFGGAADAVGRELRVDGRPYTVIGVLPESFRFVLQPDARFFVPIAFTEKDRSVESWHRSDFQMIGRLAAGATLAQAEAQIAAVNESLVARSPIPDVRRLVRDAGFHTVVVATHADLVREIRGLLYLLWGAAAFVLLIGCVNVANLMAARAHARTAELATRLALGARRGRLTRQILTEAVVVALLAAGLGLGLGALGLRALGGLGLESLPGGAAAGLDARAPLFTVVLALGTALLLGAIVAAHAARADLASVLREAGRGSTASRRTLALHGGLVTVQVALAFVLLTGTGLMARSFRAAAAVDPGFRAEGVVTAALAIPAARYPDAGARRRLTDDLLASLRALPGLEAVAVASQIPLSGSFSSNALFPEGWAARPGESVVSPFQIVASEGYFEAMGIERVEGRVFSAEDRADGVPVVVIDDQLARRFWPDRSPIGRRVVLGHAPGDPNIAEDDYATVVGVVRAVKQVQLTALDQVGTFYLSARQRPLAGTVIVARTRAEPGAAAAAMRGALARLDPELPLYDVRPMSDRIARALAARRAGMALLGVCGGVALLLAVVGMYGVLAYAVAQRTREVGIRLAMGSSTAAVFRLILRRGLVVTGVGLLLGAVASIGLGGLIRSLLFMVRPGDPAVMGAAAGLLALAAVLACVLPAWRATRVDPAAALHG